MNTFDYNIQKIYLVAF